MSAMNSRVLVSVALIAILLIGVGGTAIFKSFNSDDDEDGAKETKSSGVNLTTNEIGDPWNTQKSNVAIDDQETVAGWMQTQADPGDPSQALIQPKACNGLIGASPMFTGQAESAMLSVTSNDDFSAEDSDSIQSAEGSGSPDGPVMIQATVTYADSVSGPLAVQTVQDQVKKCVGEGSSLTSTASSAAKEAAPDGISYSFADNAKAVSGDTDVAYGITSWTKGDKKLPLININVGVHYSDAHNTATIIFIRSDVEGYDTGSADMQSILPKASSKLDETGPKLAEDEVE